MWTGDLVASGFSNLVIGIVHFNILCKKTVQNHENLVMGRSHPLEFAPTSFSIAPNFIITFTENTLTKFFIKTELKDDAKLASSSWNYSEQRIAPLSKLYSTLRFS